MAVLKTLIATLLATAACVALGTTAAVVTSWETESQAASQLRHLLKDPSQHFNQGVLSTVFPADYPDAAFAKSALSGPEYFAPCLANGDLTFLALTVSQNWRNALTAGANATFTVQSNPDPAVPDWRHLAQRHHDAWDPRRPSWRRGMPSKLRANLFGYVEVLQDADDAQRGDPPPPEAECFLKSHPDARKWAPGSKDSPHHAKWVKLRVQKIYATGGFGDEHRIGIINPRVYASAGRHRELTGSSGPGMSLPDSSIAPDELFADNTGRAADMAVHADRHSAAAAVQQQQAPFFEARAA